MSYWKTLRRDKTGIRNTQMSQQALTRLTLWLWQRGRARQLRMVTPLPTTLWGVPKARSVRGAFTPVQAM